MKPLVNKRFPTFVLNGIKTSVQFLILHNLKAEVNVYGARDVQYSSSDVILRLADT